MEGRARALDVLRAGASPRGLVASAEIPHYAAVWTRDVAFSALGAHASADATVAEAVARSLLGLARLQSRPGQIPNTWWPGRRHWDFHEAGCTDANCLYVVAADQHLRAWPDPTLERRLLPHLRRAMRWLECQDANQFTLIDSPAGGDWMDSTLQRAGKLLYVNVLYHRALEGMARLDTRASQRWRERAALLRRKIDLLLWPEPGGDHAELLAVPGRAGAQVGLRGTGSAASGFPHPIGPAARRAAMRADRWHYLSHVDGGRYVDECDVLGNVLAVLYGIPTPERARRIMEGLDASPAARPYPMRTYTRSFQAGDRWGMYRRDLEPYQDPRWRTPPGRYHNGGVWPFIGALHAVALHRVGMAEAARSALARVSAANRLSSGPASGWGFHEWIDAATGEPGGAPGQSWSAGTYLLAIEVIRGTPVTI